MAWRKFGSDRWVLSIAGRGDLAAIDKVADGIYTGSTDYGSEDFDSLSDAKRTLSSQVSHEIKKGYHNG